jgi:gamma-glutamylcysteine synthetase
MAIPKIKATYLLDPETVRAIERMAQRWRVSKSEALRRVIRATAKSGPTEAKQALAALDRLQRLLALTPSGARRWLGTARAERRAWSARREGSRE